MSSEQQWLDFYLHKGSDNQQRLLLDIWTMTFEELESTHDYIQWLFPTTEPSPINPHAPLVTESLRQKIQEAPEIRANLLRSYDTMAAFWGFYRDDDEQLYASPHIETQSKRWCCQHNHNQLRITRMLKCLTLAGFGNLAFQTSTFLLSYLNQAGLSFSEVPASLYWMSAVDSSEEVELEIEIDINSLPPEDPQ
ncbi:opioid growth factor receptor-related protein [Pleionea sp. CnH1-48]|uniref:opioid growth factor receptor-related protein n=1 Tax=Pleionea sp. CnH1-48 TaxID=2954494 RepID=UPI00209778A4|nr:opioid growth factor receptor-related protein [Pleionea sp. CnH1-48]MCO7226411.1 opioid growth factor receptor-related protein [Pleionea sp. CnH1-48]